VTRRPDPHLDDATLRLLAVDPAALDGRQAAHLAACARCNAAAAHARRDAATLRAEAIAAADDAFSPAALDRQRRSILARITRGQRSARVLAFPAHDVAVSRRRADRRWLAAAAAAGLVLGALAGQLPHLWRGPAGQVTAGLAASTPAAVVTARADSRPFDDTLLSEVEAALAPGSRPELRALDALTPVHYEIR